MSSNHDLQIIFMIEWSASVLFLFFYWAVIYYIHILQLEMFLDFSIQNIKSWNYKLVQAFSKFTVER